MMKIHLTLLYIAFAFKMASCNRCDQNIATRIKNLWNNQDAGNDGLLKELDAAGYCIVVAVTSDLVEDKDSIDRLGARFDGNTVENVYLYKNGTQITFPQFQVEDIDGMDLYTNDTQRHRFYLPFNKEYAVAAMYICEYTGVSGTPQGNVVIFSENYNKDAVEDMKKSLASVFFNPVTYPDTFPGLV